MTEAQMRAEEAAHPIYPPGNDRGVFVYGFKRGWDAHATKAEALVRALEKIGQDDWRYHEIAQQVLAEYRGDSPFPNLSEGVHVP